MNLRLFFKQGRLYAALLHFIFSVILVLMLALIVFFVWYPYPYRDISGGKDIFLILMFVDVILGPFCTLIIFSDKKSTRELMFDLGVLGFVQITALLYGLWSVYQAKPLHIVFEYSLFRVVHVNEIPQSLMKKIPEEFTGHLFQRPTVLSLRPFRNADEQFMAISQTVDGVSLSAQPGLWQAYELARPQILKFSKPLAMLRSRLPKESNEIDRLLNEIGRDEFGLVYVPLASRGKSFWTVVLDANTAEIVGFLPLDSF